MKVWILSKDTVCDCTGALLEGGSVVGVFNSLELANTALENTVESYYHKRRDYSIEEFTVNS